MISTPATKYKKQKETRQSKENKQHNQPDNESCLKILSLTLLLGSTFRPGVLFVPNGTPAATVVAVVEVAMIPP